ncbi:glyoxalase [Agromyces seonyuensis]|uniref:Glyoxalase n=1 Tax=Agromyces seonyuensis TaxID=2662446 RepID=A0A6I4NZS4_9MICO|nr:glyoxalase [Agromyces seonyuensis]MWB97935.1 glyoxalase [Agromyces seonyuensis]
MDISFVAGFGPIGRPDSHDFWAGRFGIPFHENAPGYFHSEDVPGVKAFAIWPLEQAAEATFGSPEWPADRPVPQAWIEFDVASPAAVADAVEELAGQGCDILVGAHDEPWGQTTSRLQSPEGLLVGVSFTPWMHEGDGAQAEGEADAT